MFLLCTFDGRRLRGFSVIKYCKYDQTGRNAVPRRANQNVDDQEPCSSHSVW